MNSLESFGMICEQVVELGFKSVTVYPFKLARWGYRTVKANLPETLIYAGMVLPLLLAVFSILRFVVFRG